MNKKEIENETAKCHIAVLMHMLGQVAQIKAQMASERPAHMSLPSYQKAISDIGAQHEALAFAVTALTRAFGEVPQIIEGMVTGGQPTGRPETPHDLGG